MTKTSILVAKALLEIGAIGFTPGNPLTFKSGIKSPVYIDNRCFPYHPQAWKAVIDGFMEIIKESNLAFDVIAGIETAGIPHSAALSFATGKPSVFVRKEVKDHGTGKRVEGGDVKGKTVLLVEDHVSTGSSSLSGVEALRNEGAIVKDCLAITSYEFSEVNKNFSKANVNLHPLTFFSVILDEALQRKKFNSEEKFVIEDWLRDPHTWASKYGW